MKGMDIKRAVDLKYGVNTSLNTRKAEISLPRQVAMYLCRKRTKLSYLQIARLFGRKDHSTVVYAEAKIKAMRQDIEFKQEVDGIL